MSDKDKIRLMNIVMILAVICGLVYTTYLTLDRGLNPLVAVVAAVIIIGLRGWALKDGKK
jgi:hypothetical protein